MAEQFTDFDTLRQLEPAIIGGYEAHMHPTPTRSPQPIAPVATLARLAQTSVDADIRTNGETDLLIYGPALRISLERHLVELEQEQRINVRYALAAAYLVNLLTEDNLPYYSIENDKIARFSEALAAWLREWIAEEDGHGESMRDHALLTGIIGSADLITHDIYQEGRVSQLRNGMGIRLNSMAEASVYLATQELATYYAHLNLGYLLDRPGKSLMRRISGQEYNHYEFYSGLVAKLLEIKPDATIMAIRDQFKSFKMPGAQGIPRFRELSGAVAVSGIFDVETIALIKSRLLEEWGVEDLEFAQSDAKQAQNDLLDPNSRQNKLTRTLIGMVDAERDKAVESARKSDALLPFILGRTVKVKKAQSKTITPESAEAELLLPTS